MPLSNLGYLQGNHPLLGVDSGGQAGFGRASQQNVGAVSCAEVQRLVNGLPGGLMAKVFSSLSTAPGSHPGAGTLDIHKW